MDDSNELYVKCSCGGEVLKLEYDEEIDSYYFAVFERGGDRSWKNKFKQIWKILKTGEPYSDNMVLESKKMNEVVEFIDEINKVKNE